MRHVYYCKLSSAPGIVPTIDTYLPPNTNNYNSISGFIQQQLLNSTDINSLPIGLITATSKVVISNKLFFGESVFTLFIKNKCDGEYSTINFNTVYVNEKAEPKSQKYKTTSYSGTGIFDKKNYRVEVLFNAIPDTLTKITLKKI